MLEFGTHMGAKILVVEDGDKLAAVLQVVLSRFGWQVSLARDGVEALRQVRSEPPDLIVMDLMLPRMSGYEVCKLVKSDTKTRAIPVIVLTALSQPADEKLAWEVGADRYLTKPFEYKKLVEEIESFLGRAPQRPPTSA